MKQVVLPAVLALSLTAFASAAHAQSFNEGFDAGSIPDGWVLTNNSQPAQNDWSVTTGITDNDGIVVVNPQAGPSFAVTNYTAVGGSSGPISNWLISPLISGLNNGDTFNFYTTTTPGSSYPDRMEFRLSTAGNSTDVGSSATSVGDFSSVLVNINPDLQVGGYPDSWTMYTGTVAGLTGPADGRVAFRYNVTDGGVNGSNSNVIGLDTFSYVAAVPEPASWALTLFGVCGLLGLQGIRRRARRG
ncbi:MAG: choice-of-anchor J domain-containing protein [Pseudomonadota bacterium]|nr:choice-of-anchor J domain-containing protein [Pseudomonadota bacterium]